MRDIGKYLEERKKVLEEGIESFEKFSEEHGNIYSSDYSLKLTYHLCRLHCTDVNKQMRAESAVWLIDHGHNLDYVDHKTNCSKCVYFKRYQDAEYGKCDYMPKVVCPDDGWCYLADDGK